MPPLGNYFKVRRLELHCSRFQMSKRLGVCSNSIRDWESFASIPRAGVITVNMLSEAYESSPEIIEQALTEQRRAIDNIKDQNNKIKSNLMDKIGKF